MEIKRLKTNPRMSQAVVYGGLLTTAGQVAKLTAGGSVAEQAQEILSEIEALLAAAGTDKVQVANGANLVVGHQRFFRIQHRLGCMGYPRGVPNSGLCRVEAGGAGIKGRNCGHRGRRIRRPKCKSLNN